MCTIFSEMKEQSMILAKNYDCFINEGMIFTNRRGVKKRSLVMPPNKIFEWVSKYGSITFSQSGKGMPSCGMNEEGMIVEQATLPETIYASDEEKAEISCLEVTQYLLDTCANVEQAIEAFEAVCISQTSGKIHFFLMDKFGDKAIIEFIGGQKRIIRGNEMIPILTNSEYESLCKGKEQFTSEYEENSFHRFNIVKRQVLKNNLLTVNLAFEILKAAERKDTIWSIVYDLGQSNIYFKVGNYEIKVINLKTIDFSETAPSYIYDLETIDEQFAWQPYSRELNKKCIRGFYGNSMILKILNLPDAQFVIDAFDYHIELIEEGILI